MTDGRRVGVLRTAVDAAYVTVVLRTRGVRPLLRPVPQGLSTPGPGRAAEVARLVDAGFALVPVSPTCLRRSLVLLRELHRRGLVGELCLGVRFETVDSSCPAVFAHAWVTAGGVVLNDTPSQVSQFTVLSAGDAEHLMPRLT